VLSANDRQALIRLFVVLFFLGATTACARRYTTHREPSCPPARAETHFVEDRSTLGAIAGTVLDRDSGRPIVAARIRVMPTNQISTSDAAGAFSVAGLPAGQHIVTVLRIGYERRTDTVTIRARRSVHSQIALTPASVDRCMEIIEVRTPLPWWHIW
jgi:hypothetical protein